MSEHSDKPENGRGGFGAGLKSIVLFAQELVVICVLPWSIWVTNKIYELEAFKNQGPRVTSADLRSLKLEMTAEASMALRTEVERLYNKLDLLQIGQIKIETIVQGHVQNDRKGLPN